MIELKIGLVIYLTIAVFIIVLLFLQMSGFKIKISSLLLSFEVGPEKNQHPATEKLHLAIAKLEEIDRNLKLVAANPKDPMEQITDFGDHQPNSEIESIPLDKRDSSRTSSESSFDLLKNESFRPE